MCAGQAACPFCDHDAVEPQLIAESAGFLLAADRHPLVEGHLLLIPREHVSCYGELPERLLPEFLHLKDQAATFLSGCYGPPTFFEHGIARQTVPHAHLHAAPSLPSLLPVIGVGRSPAPATGPEAVRAWSRSRGPYLYYEAGGESFLLESGQIPPGYLEGVAAGLLGERANRLDGRTLAESVRLRWQQHRAEVSGALVELVACFLRRAGRICLLLRSPAMTSAPNKWHVVSGYLPEGVDPLAHAVREIEEETGLAGEQLRLARRVDPILLQRRGDVRRWQVHPFLFDVVDGEPRLNWEHVDLRWIPRSDLASFDMVGWLPRVADQLLGVKEG